jgi:hypothetical protein
MARVAEYEKKLRPYLQAMPDFARMLDRVRIILASTM